MSACRSNHGAWMARWAVAAGAGLGMMSSARTAEACTCLPASVESSYDASSDVATVVPIAGLCLGNEQWYFAHVTQTFKGCAVADEIVLLTTPSSSAACGAELELGVEYLINASLRASYFGVKKLAFGACGYNLPADELSGSDRAFLDARNVCCGDECSCADGSEPVLCFANPCDVTQACAEAELCEANYCGGCNAEFFDAEGQRVCLPPAACASDADCAPAGCSGQLCAPVGSDIVTTCEFREEYACYQDPTITTCGCSEGQCAFAATPALGACLAAVGTEP